MRHKLVSLINFSLALLIAGGGSTECASGSSTEGACDGSMKSASGSSVEGASGSSPGSPGMDDDEASFQRDVKTKTRHSTTDSGYAESLVELGMYYNRHDRFVDAQRALLKALGVIDNGALKPSKSAVAEEKPPVVVQHSNGVVSASPAELPAPYESTLQNLLPALVTAETETGKFRLAEVHVKRLIDIAQSGKIPRVPTLMFAYNQYAELMTKQGRTKEASEYKAKAKEINSHIIGL